MLHRKARAGLVAVLVSFLFGSVSYAADVPTGDQLTQLLAPIALYPDTLLAQICAASTDPQQIIDANNWLKQNSSLQGAALTDAAQKQGFDPAFVSLVAFPAVLDSMAINVDDYAAIGAAFQADQKSVMAAIQALRQQAYASGALDTNQYQKVSVEQQNGAQVVVVQPANPQVVYVPVYQPQQVFVAAPQPERCGSGFAAEFRCRDRNRGADQQQPAVRVGSLGLGLGRRRYVLSPQRLRRKQLLQKPLSAVSAAAARIPAPVSGVRQTAAELESASRVSSAAPRLSSAAAAG